MKYIDIEINLVQVYEKNERKIKNFYTSSQAGGDQTIEWWMTEDGIYHTIFWQDAYYDQSLLKRRQSGNMICPQNKSQRLFFIGNIFNQIDLEPGSFIELFRSPLKLQNVAVGE